MKINNWLMGLIVLVVIFGGIAGTMAFNLWSTEGSGGGQGRGGGQVPVTFKVGEFAWEYNPADIRGSYSFGHIEMPARDIKIRDFAVDKGLEFGIIKEALQAKVNALQ